MPVNLIDPATGATYAIADADAPARIAEGWQPETAAGLAARTAATRRQADYSGFGDKLQATAGQAASVATAGLSDVGVRVFGGEEAAQNQRRVREANPGATMFGTALGVVPSLLTGGEGAAATATSGLPAAQITRLGAALTRAGEGASLAARVGRGAIGAGAEGALYAAGQTASDLALADDPVTLERLAGSLSSNLYSLGVPSVGIGAVGGAFEHGLIAAGKRMKAAREAVDAAPTIANDLAALDAKALREAKDAELATIEAARVPQRQALADDINAFREAGKVEQPWVAVATGSKAAKGDAIKADRLAIKAEKRATDALAEAAHWETQAAAGIDGAAASAAAARAEAETIKRAAEDLRLAANDAAANAATTYPRWMREQQRLYIEGDKYLDRVLRNPKALAENPRLAKSALQQQEHALELIQSKADELAVFHAMDKTGRRAAAMEAIPSTLERNRALQQRIDALIAAPASERLNAIADATASIGERSKLTLKQKAGAALAFGATTAAVSGIGGDVPGVNYIAPILGAAAGSAAAAKLGGVMHGARAASIARSAKAVDTFLAGTRAVRRAAVPVASRVLAEVRFAPPVPERSGSPRKAPATLADHFEARAAELGRATMPTPTGPRVRPEVRRQIGARLAPIAVVAPHVADRLESAAVRRVEFLAARLPRARQLGTTTLRPSEMEIRAFARLVAAAEGPDAIEERLADGTVTPEDREVMQALYPDRMAALVRDIVTRLPDLAKLPYQRRLALALFTGAPVEASLEPRILAALQGIYAREPGTEGGTQAPRPQPAFGSVKAPEATPAERRAG